MKIDEMLEKYCKNGVRFYKLDEIVDFLNGKGHEKNIVEHGRYIVVNSKFISTDGDTQKFSNEQICPVYKDDILMVMSDLPNGRALAKCFYVEDDDKYTLNQRICALRVKDKDLINIRFLYYYLNRNRQLLRYDNGVDQTNLRKDDILNIRVAVPPLEVQCEIVHILDDFTLLSAELSAELKARQQQYEYYKNELYSFKDKDVKYVKLKEIAEIYRGGNFQKKDFIENGKPCIHYGQIYTKYGKTANKTYTFVNDTVFEKSKQAGKNDIVMAVTSENIEDVCKCVVWLGNENIAVSGHTAIIHTKINARYLGYYFSTLHFFIDKAKLAHGTKVIEVTPSSLNDILIQVPSEEEQENIASKVEKFEKLCNDISEGLPAEIEARQKQYEYYRDKLLTFKELKVNE